MTNLDIRIWDVNHGLSAWIRTPNQQNHWIDAGYNPNPEFSPSRHVYQNYKDVSPVDLLVISHPDKDHFDDLHNLIATLGRPRALVRNKTLPPDMKYGNCQFEYQKAFRALDESYNHQIPSEQSPTNPNNNGGVTIKTAHLEWSEAKNKNDSSVVAMYQYQDTLVVFPGDIEAAGWDRLIAKNRSSFEPLIRNSSNRILIAPHHGRESGYSQAMIDFVRPSLVIVSDEFGREPTDRRFREVGLGLQVNGVSTKFISTKTNGRVGIFVSPMSLQIDS